MKTIFKILLASAIVLLFYPFFIMGYIWQEIKSSFNEGFELSEKHTTTFGEWLDGNS